MRDFKIYFAAGCLLILVYIVAQYNKPKPIDWRSTLSYEDKIPYGTFIMYHQLNDLFPNASVINTNKTLYRNFEEDSLKNGNYIVIAKTITVNRYDYKAMRKFIEKGNAVFMSAFEWKGFLADTLKLETYAEYDKSTGINFTNPLLKKSSYYKLKPGVSSQYFQHFDTARVVSLGENQFGNSNYLQVKMGKGSLYLFANPRILSNYNLLGADDYAAKALSYLPVRKNIYWDLYQNGGLAQAGSPLRVFFANPGLRWAYYLSLATFLIFILYEIKRRQRVIPVIDPLKNATLDFVNVVGKVYFEQHNNTNIAQKKILYFLEYLRTRYNLKTNTLNNEFTDALTHKTGIAPSTTQQLINYINYINERPRVSDNDLMKLNQLIEDFYKQSL
jgi:hypothetical protein